MKVKLYVRLHHRCTETDLCHQSNSLPAFYLWHQRFFINSSVWTQYRLFSSSPPLLPENAEQRAAVWLNTLTIMGTCGKENCSPSPTRKPNTVSPQIGSFDASLIHSAHLTDVLRLLVVYKVKAGLMFSQWGIWADLSVCACVGMYRVCVCARVLTFYCLSPLLMHYQ